MKHPQSYAVKPQADYISPVTRFPEYQNFSSQIPIFETSCEQPPPLSDHIEPFLELNI